MRTTDSAAAGRMKTKKTVAKKRVAKNKKNTMITTLARGLGHTAGVIVKATQRFGASVNVIPSDDLTEKVARARPRRSAAAARRKSTAKPVTSRSRKRSATVAAIKTKRRTT
jgi:hypothetical protein